MFERILVPLDGSPLAEQVLPHAAKLAEVFASEVIIIGVCESADSQQGHLCRTYIQCKSDELKTGVQRPAVAFKTVVLTGKPDERILGYAGENKVDLVIMASHGRSGIGPWSLGGTVRKVLHGVGSPMILVRVKEVLTEPVALFRRILMPLDGSPSSAAAVPFVAEIAKRMKSEVILVHVIEAGMHVHTVGGLNYIRFTDQDLKTKRANAQKYLDEINAGLGAIRAEVRFGEDAREIIRFADEVDCSLIAMSSHGYSGVEAWFYGSVTYKILSAGRQSVLLIPAPGIRPEHFVA